MTIVFAEKNGKEENSMLDSEAIRTEYDDKIYIYDALVNEALFIINDAIGEANIKIHDVEGRVKTFESLFKKCSDKGFSSPFSSITDIAGIRIICLFRSDIDKIDQIIKGLFNVVDEDNKIKSTSDSIGYMSVHYLCKMKEEYKGPRYKKISNLIFEIQVRTISMHAWSVISHYLDYKGEWDVPMHLKKSLNALSGLFYVADSEFEKFYKESQESKKNALEAQISSKDGGKSISGIPVEINFDTVSAYLSKIFPKRKASSSKHISQFVSELIGSGYKTIEDLDKDIKRSEKIIDKYEEERKLKNNYFTRVGAARLNLSVASEEFLSFRESNEKSREEYKKFKHLLS